MDGFYTVRVAQRVDVFFNDDLLVSDLTVEQGQELIANLENLFGEDIIEELEFSLDDD
jgi:hypothetical protein